MAKKRSKKQGKSRVDVDDYRHADSTRTNNPPVGLAHYDTEVPPVREFSYDPHLDPTLDWTGKAEHGSFEVEAPSIHVHERISAEAIVTSAQRRTDAERTQLALFADERLDRTKAIEFYEHELDWENRMILGDSLVAMTSLLERERLGGQVQCVFIDPPYGISYTKNAQRLISRPKANESNAGFSREPEAIQAYRDTWELGIHSYLSYLRDRLLLANELLSESGSLFFQINEEQAHYARTLLDEVFGRDNYVRTITYQKTTGSGSPNSQPRSLPGVADYLIWYAKNKSELKYRHLYEDKVLGGPGASGYKHVELSDGSIRPLTKAEIAGAEKLPTDARPLNPGDNLTSPSGSDETRFTVNLAGRDWTPHPGVWKTDRAGMDRLIEANRVYAPPDGDNLGYKRYLDDFPGFDLNNVWTDTVGQNQHAGFNRYVVQTAVKAVRRCILMTTDPGDLVLDPTCGSGTSAYVAEQFGRRWITTDTSRVALALARERLLTAKFDYYRLIDESRGVDGGFEYEAVEKTMLQTIARGEEPEKVVFYDRPRVDKTRVRVSGPFSFEALSRYALNPADTDLPPADTATDRAAASDHVSQLLDALRTQGIPRPGAKPLKIARLEPVASAGAIQAEGIANDDGGEKRFAVSLGPRFGTITPTQVDEALSDAYGYDLVVFAGFAAHAETQALLESGKRGRYEVALLLANPDLLLGSLLKNTSASQTFRLYASPDVELSHSAGGYLATVKGVDAFDASTGEVKSSSQANVRAWFLDTDYDGMVFRIDQAFFPHTSSWDSLARALKGTIDEGALDDMSGFTSIPFEPGEQRRCAVRVMTDDGNASEVILPLGDAS